MHVFRLKYLFSNKNAYSFIASEAKRAKLILYLERKSVPAGRPAGRAFVSRLEVKNLDLNFDRFWKFKNSKGCNRTVKIIPQCQLRLTFSKLMKINKISKSKLQFWTPKNSRFLTLTTMTNVKNGPKMVPNPGGLGSKITKNQIAPKMIQIPERGIASLAFYRIDSKKHQNSNSIVLLVLLMTT